MISDQPTSNKKYCAGIAAAEWSGKLSGGSDLIRAMQRWAGVTADGYLGPQTIRALQNEEVKVTMEEYIENWEIDGCEDVHEDLFDIEILEV